MSFSLSLSEKLKSTASPNILKMVGTELVNLMLYCVESLKTYRLGHPLKKIPKFCINKCQCNIQFSYCVIKHIQQKFNQKFDTTGYNLLIIYVDTLSRDQNVQDKKL